jgi:hypothetical protein
VRLDVGDVVTAKTLLNAVGMGHPPASTAHAGSRGGMRVGRRLGRIGSEHLDLGVIATRRSELSFQLHTVGCG